MTSTDHTADIVLFARDHNRVLCVLLIQRIATSDVFPGWWALPGGHVRPGETPEHAAQRYLGAETGLTASVSLTLVDRYDTPGRDPRGDVISTAYTAVLDPMPWPGDDAQAAQWIPVPLAIERGLAFDHATILTDALRSMGPVIEGT
ncbi:NUDIX domain-containing protein [Kibdelosporangium aridum]|uniref:8-oxo-dGTP diphosphatase n=1 Tax=Kibdelosporangium aridum TaxID=2030 RepID=A0A1W2DPU5_KIBAR|nr:NUDIX hydrolase [Kibdelosporangium aridum]SMC99042.1 8-oxo-dGTP diphosphatase [Kibdelosporangium aridum]